jgi:hypothetical protein
MTRSQAVRFVRCFFDAMTGPEDEEYEEDVILLLVGSAEWSDDSARYVRTAGLVLREELGVDGRQRLSRIGFWKDMESLEIDGKEAKMLSFFEGCGLEVFDLI